MRKVIRDASYWYEIHGEGEVIVLLHGFTGRTKSWSSFIEEYKAKFKIFVIDLPGHGKTRTPTPILMEQSCQDIHEVLKQNGIEKFHLVGYSLGGRTALSYAMNFQEQLTSLILESASPGLESEKERVARIDNDEKLARKIEHGGVELFIDFWENIPLFESQKKLPTEVREAIRNERLSQTKEGLALSLRCMGTGSQPSWWNDLQKVHIPVLLMVGELDQKFLGINKRMEKSLVNSELKVVHETGHAIHVEQPEFFGKLVEEFILANRKV
ncbi:2-succinyl-6-hydroxy-2,4-cyclohexadiene-1-carboxylate synthase [Paucisalibacillus sp. EB02]|uniref:2-succinyl-6-hydroxy-2, 4-cyclohexadiene-1-carboxylate synthase n=1 Tax=Paucisalibacillus sp. EB02 TaxID=1347087 RepID=UPI0004B2F155|nr:2-succinyl-6-hydroxy-2,4-cyclohexadiene-1-carboxylate synthase [Paucisalibacillus sp. EB02]